MQGGVISAFAPAPIITKKGASVPTLPIGEAHVSSVPHGRRQGKVMKQNQSSIQNIWGGFAACVEMLTLVFVVSTL